MLGVGGLSFRPTGDHPSQCLSDPDDSPGVDLLRGVSRGVVQDCEHLLHVLGRARVDVRRFESPAREELRVVVDDASLLQVDATGGLFLSVEIGAHAEEQDAAVTKTAWRIRDIYLTADAIVLEQK